MLTALNPYDYDQPFPETDLALPDPNGLLAIGGCLSPRRLLNAYRQGIFPWYNDDEPILWWSPNPRLVLFPERLNVSHSLRKAIRRGTLRCSFDTCFGAVVDACAAPRAYTDATWVSPDIARAYTALHRLGHAHSFEAWHGDELVGGLYGVSLGQVFFGESMFHRESNASKIAFAYAVDKLHGWGYQLIDCQVHTGHLASLGAEEIPRADFIRLLDQYCELAPAQSAWQLDEIPT